MKTLKYVMKNSLKGCKVAQVKDKPELNLEHAKRERDSKSELSLAKAFVRILCRCLQYS